MPRRSLRVGDRRGDPPVGEAERGLEAVGFEAEGGFERKRPGAVLVGAGGLLDEGLDGFDGHPRRDLAGDVAAHAVGDDEEADVGTGAVAVFVAGAPQTGVRAYGPAERQRRRRSSTRRQALRRASASARRPAPDADARRDLQPRQRLHQRHRARARSRCRTRLRRAAPRRASRAASARSTSISSARSASCARIVTRSGSTSANPNAIDR